MGTLQLGEPAIIAARTATPVIADFRPADMAAGGQGAPLVAFADEVLFGKDHVPTAVLNIGGIANMTVLNGDGTAIMAFDTGPGNMLIDRAMEKLYGRPYDANGDVARSGSVDRTLLSELMSNPYLHRRPPKTTGRELFGVSFADEALESANAKGVSDADCVATLTAFTVQSIAAAYQDFVLPRQRVQRLIIGGGGGDNAHMLKELKQTLPSSIAISKHEQYGVSTKFKEALLFALLAYTTYFKIPNNVPECTGASRRVCLGKLVLP